MAVSHQHHRLRPFLRLRNAAFRLGDRVVFENTTWTFQRGEHWAIIGANGSGKSVLADGIRGCLPLVAGELNYGFVPPAGLVAEEAIGHVSFDQRKHEVRDTVVQSRWNSLEEDEAVLVRDCLSYERVLDINPFEVIQGGAEERKRKQFAQRRRQMVSLLRLESFLERRLISLSNGETQRVQLARALCRPLRLLILDEAFQGLDTDMRGYFREVLQRLMVAGLPVLLITTRLEDLPRQVSHALLVSDCLVAAAGPAKQILALAGSRQSLISNSRPRPFNDGNVARSEGNSGLSTGSMAHGRRKSAGTGECVRQPLVRLRNVTVAYGDAVILRDLNWTVQSGESWALLGPNGSGKTTLLSLILGDNPQVYRNEIEVFGKRRGSGESIWEIKRGIGWVSPELHLHFNDTTTCLEAVVSGFRDTVGLFEPPTRRQRTVAREWLSRFCLLASAGQPLFELSTGLQRMVLLARALVKQPRLLVLDEPCQGLDPAHRRAFVEAVDSLVRRRLTTAIYVTHRVDEIPRSIKRVLRLR